MSPQQPPRRRHNPPPAAPTRRPRVAGLRKPSGPGPGKEGKGRPEADGVEDTRDTEIIPAVPADEAAKPSPRPKSRRTRPETSQRPGSEAAALRRERPRAEAAEPVAAEMDDEVDDEVDDGYSGGRFRRLLSAGAGAGSAAARPGGLMMPITLGVITVLLGGFAFFAWSQWQNLSGGVAVENTALTDQPATSEVIGEVTSAVNTLFSYNYTNLGKTEQAVPNLLTGNATCQYNLIFKTVQQQAPAQKLVLTTTVVNSAVQMLQGDNARVLLVVDQRDVRATTNQQSETTAAFAVNATQGSDNRWKISGIDTFNGQPTQSCGGK